MPARSLPSIDRKGVGAVNESTTVTRPLVSLVVLLRNVNGSPVHPILIAGCATLVTASCHVLRTRLDSCMHACNSEFANLSDAITLAIAPGMWQLAQSLMHLFLSSRVFDCDSLEVLSVWHLFCLR